MYINSIDNLFDNYINNLYKFLLKNKVFDKIYDTNFVKYQNIILKIIEEFIKSIDKKNLNSIAKNSILYNNIIDLLKKYCCFYIFLGISYYYKGGRDLFITNLMEISKLQKDSTFEIKDFFNSENNSKIIEYYEFIKNIIKFTEIKDIDKVKILLNNNPLVYENTIILFNELGEDYINEFFLIKDNFHNIIKTLILKFIYIKLDKSYLNNLLNEKEIENAVYRYIEVIKPSSTKIIDLKNFQKLLTLNEIKLNKNLDYYVFIEENNNNTINVLSNNEILNFLFTNKILIPITEDYLRYHKNLSKSNKKYTSELENIKDRDSTKIKYIVNQNSKIQNLYSPAYNKNNDIKKTIENYFYKPMRNRNTLLYNDIEEINIINKLEQSDTANDKDLLFDLNVLRKYSYVNFKHLSKDGFKFRPKNMIQCIRYTNLNKLDNNKLELRVAHNNLSMNIVGVVFNPKNLPLECFSKIDLVNVKKKPSDNGFKELVNLLNLNNSKKLYYWLFNNKTDKAELSYYKNLSSSNSETYIKVLLEEFYYNYEDKIKNNIFEDFKKKSIKNFFNFNNLKDKLIFNINSQLDNYFINNLKNVDILDAKEDLTKKIKLKKSTKINKQQNIIVVKEKEKKVVNIDKSFICYHYIQWMRINKIPKKSDKFNQAIFNFVKQYVKTNENNDYICKSCNEMLNLKKYIYEGTYVKELDTFLTTNIAVNQDLFNIPKYSKYSRSIRNIEKNLEKLCYSLNLNYYLGNTPVIKLRRRMVIKDVIDLILIHTQYLKKKSKDRIKIASENYNIHKDLTNLFFFELKDDIFLTSSTDTDYYKKIKYNNILAYMVFLLIIEINTGQIIQLKEDKFCNIFLFNKIGKKLFENIFLRVNKNEKILISSIPLLCYIIFYFSCMLTNNFIWLWNLQDKSQKINTQKIIIHTIIDLINSIVEAKEEDKSDFIYELILNRFLQKIKNTYNDKNTFDRLTTSINNKFKYNKETKKIMIVTKKIESIPLSGIFNQKLPKSYLNNLCNSKIIAIKNKVSKTTNNTINQKTNCLDGKFHKWIFKENSLQCIYCNKKYIDLKKNINDDPIILKQIEINELQKLTKTYCIDGNTHNFSVDNICKNCGKEKDYQYSNNSLLKLKNNLKLSKQKIFNEKSYKNEKNKKLKDAILNKYVDSMEKLKNKYKTIENFSEYILNFIKNLSNYTSDKIVQNNKSLYLKETLYIIDHDYLGNIKKKNNTFF